MKRDDEHNEQKEEEAEEGRKKKRLHTIRQLKEKYLNISLNQVIFGCGNSLKHVKMSNEMFALKARRNREKWFSLMILKKKKKQ